MKEKGLEAEANEFKVEIEAHEEDQESDSSSEDDIFDNADPTKNNTPVENQQSLDYKMSVIQRKYAEKIGICCKKITYYWMFIYPNLLLFSFGLHHYNLLMIFVFIFLSLARGSFQDTNNQYIYVVEMMYALFEFITIVTVQLYLLNLCKSCRTNRENCKISKWEKVDIILEATSQKAVLLYCLDRDNLNIIDMPKIL